MSDLSGAVSTRSQLRVIAELRWRLFLNSLRSRRGKMELASRSLVALVFTVAGVGGAVLLGGAAWYFISQGKPEYLPLLPWPVFLFWQSFPLMATAFTNNPDSSELLRFPLNYRAYFLVRVIYGSLEPATALGSLWLVAIAVGVTIARPQLILWATFILVIFALFNIFLQQMLFAWIERWLAQRRTREVIGVLFILLMVSLQLAGPLMEHFHSRSSAQVDHWLAIIRPMQQVLPPGLSADAIAQVYRSNFLAGWSSFVLLTAFTMAAASLLHLRLRAQFRGENLSEVQSRTSKKGASLHRAWNLPGIPSVVAAVLEKELRYLSRSGPMVLTIIMPMIMLVIFRLGPMSATRHSAAFMRVPDMAFPGAVGYTLLVLTNLIYNNFGADAAGIQFFFAAPVKFGQIVAAKNLTHAAILLFDVAIAWFAVTFLYGAPRLDITIAALAGLLFAAPVNFTVGNFLSIYSPKRVDFSTFGRQRASQITMLASLGVQILAVGIGAAVFILAKHYGNYWLATLIFLILAAVTISIYAWGLRDMDRFAVERRETMIGELCRA